MGLLKGGLTVRRFRVVGDLPAGWRETYRDRLNGMAFREPAHSTGKEELEGWVQIHNLLDANFDVHNRWLYNEYVVFALRVDKKTLPAKLFRATAEKRIEAWCEERGVEKCPGSVKKEIKEALEKEWLARALPRVQLTEICWNTQQGWALVSSTSDKTSDRIRKRFHRTFGLELHPFSPLDYLSPGDTRDRLMATSAQTLGGDA